MVIVNSRYKPSRHNATSNSYKKCACHDYRPNWPRSSACRICPLVRPYVAHIASCVLVSAGGNSSIVHCGTTCLVSDHSIGRCSFEQRRRSFFLYFRICKRADSSHVFVRVRYFVLMQRCNFTLLSLKSMKYRWGRF